MSHKNISFQLATILFIYFICDIFIIQCNGNVVKKDNHNVQSGSMIGEIAKELIERSKNKNQILNINISNLLLLIFLKSVVFGANYIGNSDYKSRQAEDNILSEDEISLALGFLIGDTCLYRAACEVPETAKNYLGALDMIIQTMKLMPQMIRFDRRYDKTIAEIRKAIEYGDTKRSCPPEYSCKKENIKNFLRPE